VTTTEAPAGTPRALVVGLVLAVTMVGFEALAVVTVLPSVRADLGGLSLYGWVSSAFMLANLIGIAIAGAAADRRGPAPVLAVGLGLFAVGLVIAGVAPTMLVVVLARVAQGLGAGAITSAAYIGIARGVTDAARPRMLAILSSAWVIPGLVGPAIAGAVAEHLTWRLVFLGLVPLTLLPALTAVPALATLGGRAPDAAAGDPALEVVADGKARSTVMSATRLAGGVALGLVGLGLRSWWMAGALVVVGAVVGVSGLRRLVPAGTFTARPGPPGAVAFRFGQNLAFFTADLFLPLLVTSVKHGSPTQAGLSVTAGTVSWTAGSWIQARLAPRVGRRRLLLTSMGLIAIGVALTATGLSSRVPIVAVAAAWVIAGLGMGIGFGTATLVVLEGAGPDEAGRASAAVQLAETLSIALGTGLTGAWIALGERRGWSPSTGVAAAFVVAALGGVLATAAALRAPTSPRGAT